MIKLPDLLMFLENLEAPKEAQVSIMMSYGEPGVAMALDAGGSLVDHAGVPLRFPTIEAALAELDGLPNIGAVTVEVSP